jgi:cytochrome c oxidase cbb3-type subunit 3
MKLNTGSGLICGLAGAGLLVWSLAFQAAVPAANGAAIFEKNCMMCHAAGGKGFSALKTPNFTDPKWQSSINDKQMWDVVKNGKKRTQMPASHLKDEEISAVVAYIRSLNSSKKK